MIKKGDTIHIFDKSLKNNTWFKDEGYFTANGEKYIREIAGITSSDLFGYIKFDSFIYLKNGGYIPAYFIKEFYESSSIYIPFTTNTGEKINCTVRIDKKNNNFFLLPIDIHENINVIFNLLGCADIYRDLYIEYTLGIKPTGIVTPQIPFSNLEDLADKLVHLVFQIKKDLSFPCNVKIRLKDFISVKESNNTKIHNNDKVKESITNDAFETNTKVNFTNQNTIKTSEKLTESQEYIKYMPKYDGFVDEQLQNKKNKCNITFVEFKYKRHEKNRFHRTR